MSTLSKESGPDDSGGGTPEPAAPPSEEHRRRPTSGARAASAVGAPSTARAQRTGRAPSTTGRLLRTSLIALLAMVLGGALVVALAATGAAATVQESGSTVADAEVASDDPPDEHLPPEEPLDPDEFPDRDDVEDTSQWPYSAIGHVSGDEYGEGSGSGVLVSDYHVLTNAHIVTDDDGNVGDGFTFTSGYRSPPGDEVDTAYGRAQVENVRVHSEWEGDAPVGDLALLTLDRPVGQVAGHVELGGVWDETDAPSDLQQAGYIGNVTGTRMMTSTPETVASETSGDSWRHYYCAPTGNGDSGSPVWTEIDGQPRLVTLHAIDASLSQCEHDAGGVPLNADRVAWIEDAIAEDSAPAVKADLRAVGEHRGPSWETGVETVASGPITDLESELELQTVVYNNGPDALSTTSGGSLGDATTVQFSVRTGDGYVELCSDIVSMGSYESAVASCTAENLDAVDTTRSFATFAADVDANDEIDEYTEAERRIVGTADLQIDNEAVVEGVEAPEHAARGTEFDASATISNAGTQGSLDATVEADLEHGTCDPETQSLNVHPSITGTAFFDCTIDEGASADEATLTVSSGGDSTSAEIDVTELDYSSEANFEVTDMDISGLPEGVQTPAIEPGDDYVLSGTVENTGEDASARYVHFANSIDCANLDGGTYQASELIRLEPGESQDLSYYCDIPYDALGDASEDTLSNGFIVQHEPDQASGPRLTKFVDEWGEDEYLTLVEPAENPTFEVESVSAPDAASVGEEISLLATVYNDGSPGEEPVSLTVDGETVDSHAVEINRYRSSYASLSYTPTAEDAGELNLTVDTGTETETVSVDVEATGPDVSIGEAPDRVMHAAETVSVEANVTNDGADVVTDTVELRVDGETVHSTDVEVAAGDTETVELSGAVDPAGSETLTVEVASSADSDARTVDVAEPLDLTLRGEHEPQPHGEDGLYRDVTGDGEVGQGDVAVFFGNQHRDVMKRPAYFDFSGNGAVTHGDVVALADYVALN